MVPAFLNFARRDADLPPLELVSDTHNKIYDALVNRDEEQLTALINETLGITPMEGLDYIKVLAYDVDKSEIINTSDVLTSGVAGFGGFRGSISASNKGNGLLSTEGSSGTGEFVTYRVTLTGDTLTMDVVNDFNLSDESESNNEVNSEEAEIAWYDITDDSELVRLEKQEWK